jgi:hypothetical protein
MSIPFFAIFSIDPDEAGDSWQHGVGAAEFPVVKSQLCNICTCFLRKMLEKYYNQVSR